MRHAVSKPFLNQSLAIPHIYGRAHHSRRCEEGQLQLKPPSPPPPLPASMLPPLTLSHPQYPATLISQKSLRR